MANGNGKVLVLGATGGIGSEVARQLRDQGWEVRALHAVADTLLLDFDPSEALIFLESKGVISEDYVKLIESRVSTAD